MALTILFSLDGVQVEYFAMFKSSTIDFRSTYQWSSSSNAFCLCLDPAGSVTTLILLALVFHVQAALDLIKPIRKTMASVKIQDKFTYVA